LACLLANHDKSDKRSPFTIRIIFIPTGIPAAHEGEIKFCSVEYQLTTMKEDDNVLSPTPLGFKLSHQNEV
jgi:hypothetical protein